MGSRRGGDYSKFAVKGPISTAIHHVQDAITSDRGSRIIANTAIDVIVASQPTIATLVATYKISKWAYQTYQKAEKTYEKTGDSDKAAEVVAKETIKYGVATARDEAIGAMVDVGWNSVKQAAGVGVTNELQDRILRSATKETLDEVLPK